MRNLTNADLQALASEWDTDDTHHGARPEWARKQDAKRDKRAKRETLARRQARTLKREFVAA
jgi:hypothetical protein